MTTGVLIGQINDYKKKLELASKWHNSKESIAPIIEKDSNKDKNKEDSYVYEFFCYLSLINDLMSNYEIIFVKGIGLYEYKFPQAASIKSGKPRFEALENGEVVFQICAGTRVIGVTEAEDINPDISFQHPNATDNPTAKDLIIILDAKYQDNFKSRLKGKEFHAFSFFVNQYYKLPNIPSITIKFKELGNFYGNCLITNVRSHNKNDTMMKLANVREIVKFYPGLNYEVFGV
jgi:hypothetical protein